MYDSEDVGTALPAQQYKVKKIGERAPLVIRFIQSVMVSKIHYFTGINLYTMAWVCVVATLYLDTSFGRQIGSISASGSVYT